MITPEILVHSAKAYSIVSIGSDRKPVYSEAVELSKVRISLKKGFTNGSNGLEVADSMTFYFDCEVSEPSGFVPVERMKIEFNNSSYTISSVKASYGLSDTPAFYTCELK